MSSHGRHADTDGLLDDDFVDNESAVPLLNSVQQEDDSQDAPLTAQDKALVAMAWLALPVALVVCVIVATTTGHSRNNPLVQDDIVVFGMLMAILCWIFQSESSKTPFWRKFYKAVPSLLLCYFIPGLMASAGVFSPNFSKLNEVCSSYMLPPCLVLLTLSVDLKEVLKLGPKALIMFFTGTAGVIIGGPLSVLIMHAIAPSVVGGTGANAVWRGLTCIAGSWIGGSANQLAMKEVFDVGRDVFSMVVAVDVVTANLWMGVLLFLIGKTEVIDNALKADTSAITALRIKMERFQKQVQRIPTTTDLMTIACLGIVTTGIAQWVGTGLATMFATYAPGTAKFSLTDSFFWLIVLTTSAGLVMSFTQIKKLEGVGASKLGSVFLYILVATIGMQMDVTALVKNPGLLAVGVIWMTCHVCLLFIVARLIKAPLFFLAVGSQANVGGAASAPVIAAAFHPALAPVGVLLAVLGYCLGTYGAVVCGYLLRAAAGG